MKKFNYENIVNTVWGSSLMAGGGGGALGGGIELLENYIQRNNVDKDSISLDVVSPSEMRDGAKSGVVAAIGSPVALKQRDLSKDLVSTFDSLCEYIQPDKIEYLMAVEMGSFSTFAPMLISLAQNTPFLDTDGAARAVPGLPTLLLHVNGNDTSPLVLVNVNESGGSDKVCVELADPKAALLAENLARNVAIAFGMICGLGGWVMDKASVVKTLPEGTISIAESVGAVLRDKSITKKFDALSEKNIVKCKEIVRGPVVNAETKLEGGFDFGFFEVKAEDGAIWRVDFQNENLVLSVGSGSIGEVKMTVPDIIACYNMDTGEPLTNADMFYDDGKFIEQNVVIGAIKVDEKWWMRGEEHVYSIWQEFFRRINYSGPIVKY